MVTVTFILDTNVDRFADWLSTRWSELSANCVFDTRNGTVQLQALRDTQQNQTRTLAATLAFTTPIHPWQHYPGDAIGFELSPIAESRVEVRISCLSCDLLPWLVDLLSKMVKRWSVMRDTLEVAIGKLPTDENEQQALIVFSHHMRYLKIKPGQRAAMYGTTPARNEAQHTEQTEVQKGIDGGTQRDDGPANAELDPDSIPRWGTRHDLSTWEVRDIVRRCKQYQEAGGSINKFHEQESRHWPEPEDSPKSYSAKTLASWKKRFQ